MCVIRSADWLPIALTGHAEAVNLQYIDYKLSQYMLGYMLANLPLTPCLSAETCLVQCRDVK